MTIDTIMNPRTSSKSELQVALTMTLAVAEAIRSAGSIPSGHLYAMLTGRVSIDGFQSMIRTLKNAGLVEERSHELRWIGPQLEASR